MNKSTALTEAIEIVKEYGRGGYSDLQPDVLLERMYKKLLELGIDQDSQSYTLPTSSYDDI